jgi:endonuclease YncB( thermonuclease family)
MISKVSAVESKWAQGAIITLCGIGFIAAAPAHAASCNFEPQGEGRVAAVIDARTVRLSDGREVRLAGIEAVTTTTPNANRTAALAAIVAGRDVTLRGQDDTPDRYGRQPAFVFLGVRTSRCRACCWRKARRWSRLP